MMDLDPAVEAAGRAVCRDGWDVAAERAVHIGSVRAAVTAAYPIIAEAIARATADAIADKIRAERESAWKAWGNYEGWSTYATAYGEAERIARAHGQTPQVTD